MKQIQNLTDQMTLMVRSQQPNMPPSPVKSGRHASGLWCVQCGSGHTKQFCRMGLIGTNEAWSTTVTTIWEPKSQLVRTRLV